MKILIRKTKAIKNLIVKSIESVKSMTSRERNALLCHLSVKELMNTILPHETIQLELIQAIRKENGEMDRVLKNWAEHPELDPRIQ